MLAGYATSDITPEIGATLDGFLARLSPATGIDLPLYARSLWLEHESTGALIVSLDILCLGPAVADMLVATLADDLALPANNIILAASHTHAGAMTARLRGLGRADETYLSALIDEVRRSAADAVANKCPATIAWGEAEVAMGVNRREYVDGEGIKLGTNPDGPADDRVRIVHVGTECQSIVLFHHACHPYCQSGDTALISPDLFGHAAEALAADGHAAVYLNGCAGDIRPWRAFEGVTAAREEGERLAHAASEAIEGTTLARNDLRIASCAFTIPHDTPPDMAQLAAELDQSDRTVRDEERGDPQVGQRLHQAWCEWHDELTDAMRSGPLPPIPARVSVMTLGGGAIVALPGEVFFEIGQAIASRLAASPVCVAAYCHGYIGYVPTPHACAEGGYEVTEAHRYMGLWRISPQAATMIEKRALQLWRDVGGELR